MSEKAEYEEEIIARGVAGLEIELKRIADALENIDKVLCDIGNIRIEEKTFVQEEALPKEDLTLEGIEFKIETEKARLIKNKVGKVAWIPKKAIIAMTELEGIGNITIAHWFRPKLKWEEAKQ